jgi:beta-lactamase regulating signal transducer with metallopeptidase domain
MTNFANWVSADLLRTLGWTLLHFIWQGAALAALFAAAVAACRSAAGRYAVAVGTLVLMMALPVITFTWLHRESIPAVRSGAQGALPWVERAAQQAAAPSSAPAAAVRSEQPTAMLWLVELWFLGVVILSLRTAGGLLLIERMRRREIQPVGRELYLRCIALQLRMGVERVVRYCGSQQLDAPAVLGWFRPVVLLPVRALMGLSEEQMEAVMAHELAHIRRLDCFVNLFQIGVETLLFYHPAVWWVSQRIRAERENCCDDEAIAVCGDAVNYARALTLMEEWRTAPALVMAANRSPLAERVVRVLGLNGATGRTRMAGLGVSCVCLAGALLAGNAFLGVAHASLGNNVPAKQTQESGSVIVVKPEAASMKERAPRAAKPAPVAEPSAATPTPNPQATSAPAPQAASEGKKQSYIEAMEAAGFKNLNVDELIAMKVQGVTPEYIKAMHDLGLKPTADEIVGMKVQGITPEYVREMRTVASNPSVEDLIGMKVQGITPEYITGMHDLGFHPTGDEIVGMKVQGITPEYIREMKTVNPNPTVESLIGMKVQGITPQYAKEMRDLGLHADADELIGMKVQGVTPEYVKEMRAEGLKPDTDELIGMKVQGITPEYVKSMQAAGFKNLQCDELIGAKVQGVTPEFIEQARKHGFQNLTLEKLIALKQAGIL